MFNTNFLFLNFYLKKNTHKNCFKKSQIALELVFGRNAAIGGKKKMHI